MNNHFKIWFSFLILTFTLAPFCNAAFAQDNNQQENLDRFNGTWDLWDPNYQQITKDWMELDNSNPLLCDGCFDVFGGAFKDNNKIEDHAEGNKLVVTQFDSNKVKTEEFIGYISSDGTVIKGTISWYYSDDAGALHESMHQGWELRKETDQK